MPDHIYKRGQTWWLRVVLAGKEIRRSLQTADRALARKRAASELERLNRQKWGDERRTWVEAVEHWLEGAAGNVKPSTIQRYALSLRVVGPVLEPLWLDEIDRKVMLQIAGRKGVTNATKRRDLTAVSRVLAAAAAAGWIDRNPAREIDRSQIRERRDPIVLPTDAEVRHLVASCPAMIGRLVLLLRQTGMRLEEAASLTWRQVDLNRRTITLERTKAGRVRTVPLSEAAVGTLSGTPRHLACPLVFWHSQEHPRRYHRLDAYLLKLRRAAGISWRTHDLRHLFAVEYLKGGGSIYDLQQVLGHGSLTVTERYLEHLTPDEKALAKAQGAAQW